MVDPGERKRLKDPENVLILPRRPLPLRGKGGSAGGGGALSGGMYPSPRRTQCPALQEPLSEPPLLTGVSVTLAALGHEATRFRGSWDRASGCRDKRFLVQYLQSPGWDPPSPYGNSVIITGDIYYSSPFNY